MTTDTTDATDVPQVRRRARPMSPQERRDTLVDATLDLLRQHGRSITTRQIAEAAGVAEGTIFRVVESKDELVDLAIARSFEPGPLERRILEIDLDRPLRERLLVLVAILQQRFRATFVLMQKVGIIRPPDHVHDTAAAVTWRARLAELMVGVVVGRGGDELGLLAVPPERLAHTLRLLTFSGSHPHISDGHLLTPEEIVDTLLDGLLRRD